MFKHLRVAIDFDGTLFEDIGNIDHSFENKVELTPIKGAKETTHWLKKNEFVKIDNDSIRLVNDLPEIKDNRPDNNIINFKNYSLGFNYNMSQIYLWSN